MNVTLSQLCLGSEHQFWSPRPFMSYLDSDAIAFCTPVPKVDPPLLPNPIVHLGCLHRHFYQLLSRGVERPVPCFHTWENSGGSQGRPWLGGAHCHPGLRSPEAPEQRAKAGTQSRAFCSLPTCGGKKFLWLHVHEEKKGLGQGKQMKCLWSQTRRQIVEEEGRLLCSQMHRAG